MLLVLRWVFLEQEPSDGPQLIDRWRRVSPIGLHGVDDAVAVPMEVASVFLIPVVLFLGLGTAALEAVHGGMAAPRLSNR